MDIVFKKLTEEYLDRIFVHNGNFMQYNFGK